MGGGGDSVSARTVYAIELLNVKSPEEWRPIDHPPYPYDTADEARDAALAYVDAWRDGRKVRVVKRTTTDDRGSGRWVE